MKKKVLLMLMAVSVSASLLTGCSVSVTHDSSVEIGEESSAASTEESSVEEKTEASKESETAQESSAAQESETTQESSVAQESETTQESSVAQESSTSQEVAASGDSEYIGMTVNDFVAEGNEHSGYTGFNGEYEFYAINEDAKAAYKFTLSDDATEIMENKDFFDDYEDLIGDCTITDMEVQYADDTKLEGYVGKTLADLEADGISPNGYFSMGSLTLTATDNLLSVYIEFSEADAAIYESMNDPDIDDVIEAYSDCTIESIYYVL